MVNRVEAMEKHSWPNGVTSWNDTVKFAQLVFGMDVEAKGAATLERLQNWPVYESLKTS